MIESAMPKSSDLISQCDDIRLRRTLPNLGSPANPTSSIISNPAPSGLLRIKSHLMSLEEVHV
ncbi:hypothetical protein N7453_006739 [Penicillium expansum]|nr:hypothetical protein N7453_006739 [Penicillium expansum]